jgi:hypothetical protein
MSGLGQPRRFRDVRDSGRRSLAGDLRPLLARHFKCAGCGTRSSVMFLFAKRTDAEAWADGRDEAAGLIGGSVHCQIMP